MLGNLLDQKEIYSMVRQKIASCRGTSHATYNILLLRTQLALGLVQRNKFKTFSSHHNKDVLKLEEQIHAFWCISLEPKRDRLTAIFSKARVYKTPLYQ